MNQSEFEQVADNLLIAIDDQLYDSGVDIDCENSGGILTLTCEANGSHIIVSKQLALREIWVAAKSGGFHLQFRANQWHCRVTGETLAELMVRVCQEQTQESIAFDL